MTSDPTADPSGPRRTAARNFPCSGPEPQTFERFCHISAPTALTEVMASWGPGSASSTPSASAAAAAAASCRCTHANARGASIAYFPELSLAI
eukprot:CAMPEP_0206458318 /NCGR_PEP_ID=MMETSP0324_2-20121206/23494_1 /ASSEMBLY_ACC=CAM_ASM_000836 /TAXON_ID=2866 /ORGANISM="Crypthecodinium cohnii, Strain Seligo" /LENGTH=92 /DNA_ID=CAMNT_0053929625 /DNA_START=365 /DNA_END=643 /DNA_ORIENTATION=+